MTKKNWCPYCRDSSTVIWREGYRIPACEACWRYIDSMHDRERLARAAARRLHPAGKDFDVVALQQEIRHREDDPDSYHDRKAEAKVIYGVFG
jgi:hypothetical protein